MNALHLAAIGGHLEIVKYLMPIFGDSKFDMDNLAQSCLHKAVKEGHPKVVRYLIEEGGLDPSLRDKVGHFKSHAPSCAGVTNVLLQDDRDCFHLACYHGNLEVVRELVERHKVNPHIVAEVCVQCA